MKLSRILLILASIAVIVAFFVPYFAGGHSNSVSSNGDQTILNTDVTIKEADAPSLLTYTKVYLQGGSELFRNASEGIFYAVLYIAVPVFGLLLFIFALGKKPIPALIFSILLAALGYAIHWDFTSKRIINEANSTFGAAYYMIYAGAAVAFVMSIAMIVAKHKLKAKN